MAAATSELITKICRFLLVGGFATALQYGLLVVFIELASMKGVLASALSYSISAIANYWLNYHFTFVSSADHKAAFSKFILVALIGLAANTLIFTLMYSKLAMHYLAAQIIATVIVLCWNFIANNVWSFKT